MKNILVEFTDHGAIIHKSESVIEEKKDLPHCLLNPDLSSVSGVSPSYWMLTESGKIAKCSSEEIERRNNHHASIASSASPKMQLIDDLRQELYSDFEVNLNDLKSELYSLINDLNLSVDFIAKTFTENKELNKEKIKQIEKQLTMYKIALIVSTVIALIGALK